MQHRVDIPKNVVIPETQNAIAFCFDQSCPCRIGSVQRIVLATIHLDDQFGLAASKNLQ